MSQSGFHGTGAEQRIQLRGFCVSLSLTVQHDAVYILKAKAAGY